MLLVEILRSSTEAYDRGAKLAHCRALPSLKAVLFVRQSEPGLELFARRDDGTWELHERTAGTLRVAAIEVDLDVAVSGRSLDTRSRGADGGLDELAQRRRRAADQPPELPRAIVELAPRDARVAVREQRRERRREPEAKRRFGEPGIVCELRGTERTYANSRLLLGRLAADHRAKRRRLRTPDFEHP